MITILTTTEKRKSILEVIQSIDRLDELVTVVDQTDALDSSSRLIRIFNDTITSTLDWFDSEPPYIIPEIPYSSENALALVFFHLGNEQRAFEFISEDTTLFQHLLIATHLMYGYEIDDAMFAGIESAHNRSIVQHYGNCTTSYTREEIIKSYSKALAEATSDDTKIFSAKHYTNLLLDLGAYTEIEELMRSLSDVAISEHAKNAVNTQLASALQAQLQYPYKSEQLDEIMQLMLNGIQHYEANDRNVNAGLLYIEASEIANYQEDYSESKNLINKAILYFKEAEIPEFLGEAVLRKATLLYTWSKDGSPQYYKPAINAFQDALKIFKRESNAEKCAEVQHQLALIYSEMPTSLEEKAMWSAFSASAFNESLKFYTKEGYPYQHAMVSHNYATALMGFPEAKLHDNIEKADGLFESALSIRTAQSHPFERALTLANQLELYWLKHNEGHEEEAKSIEAMTRMANEIKQLVADDALIAKANDHLNAINELKTVLS